MGFQREKRSGGGASGHGVRNRKVAGGADCPSVLSGLTPSVDSGIDGSLGARTTVCGRCSLRAVSFGCGRTLVGSFGVFSGGTTGVASGDSSGGTPRPLGSLSDSTHRKKVSFSSSIAAHPARPKLVDTATRTSATRARARVDVLVIRRVGGSSSAFGAKRRVPPYGCREVNRQPAPMLWMESRRSGPGGF
jgi:hypothetical protein